MLDGEAQKIIDKRQKILALHHARERVRQLERELDGAPARPEEPPHVPEFLRRRVPLTAS
jgi:hypothetical protein